MSRSEVSSKKATAIVAHVVFFNNQQRIRTLFLKLKDSSAATALVVQICQLLLVQSISTMGQCSHLCA